MQFCVIQTAPMSESNKRRYSEREPTGSVLEVCPKTDLLQMPAYCAKEELDDADR